MFGFLCGWRKASKCKKLIKLALCRLKMLKKKRYSIIKQLREDLFELINNGYQQIAFNRVEQLIRDEILMEAYDLIENFCEFILVKFSHIRKHKTCPDDIIEAISSLIFASARCGNFPELKLVRKLFEKRYGQSFARAAIELGPGNLVNSQIKEKLLMKAVSDHKKRRLISEMARGCFYPAMLDLEYCPDWDQKQVLANEDQTNDEGKEEPKAQDSNAEALERVVICLDSSRDNSRDIVDPISSSSFVCQSFPNEREEVCSSSNLASLDLSKCNGSGWIAAATLEDGLGRENGASSLKEAIVYLDDVIELPDPSMEYGDLLDQRFFKFKFSITSMQENVRDGNDQCLIEKHDDSNKKSISEEYNQIINGSPEGVRRISMCRERENQNLRKKKLRNCSCLSCHSLSSEMENYCLEQQPCYFYSECRTDDYVVISEEKKINSYSVRYPAVNHSDCEFETVVYDVFVYSNCQADESTTKGKDESSVGFNGMQNKFRKCTKGADKYPSHVHPKLPDYDEIAAKFIGLKREYLSMKGGN